MDPEEIRSRIKKIIHHVTNIPVTSIDDNASFQDDLDLDSLALLELGVGIDYEFKLGIEDLEKTLASITSLPASVEFVRSQLAERVATV
jgi:acyl carrier protein